MERDTWWTAEERQWRKAQHTVKSWDLERENVAEQAINDK